MPLIVPHHRCLVDHQTAEDSLNIALREITVTARDGRVSQLEQVYIRGSMVRARKRESSVVACSSLRQIRFMIVPDLLAQAPM